MSPTQGGPCNSSWPLAPEQEGEAVVVMDRGLVVLGYTPLATALLGVELLKGRRFDPVDIFVEPWGQELGQALGAVATGELASRSGTGLEPRATGIRVAYSVHPLWGPGHAVEGVLLTLKAEGHLARELLGPGRGLPCEAVLEHLAEGVFTVNTSWRITSFNRSAERITGYRRREVLGRHCWEVFCSDLCESGCPLRQTMEQGRVQMDQGVRILLKGGRRLTVLVNTSLLTDASGRVVGAVESFRPLELPEAPSEGASWGGGEIVGASAAMKKLFAMLPEVAASEANVLIVGETGTGKELFARAIHARSPRCKGPFVAVNCSALAESLLESELFGHEKGAFTGAVTAKPGRFELAKGGTLFLDEIGELKPQLQVKLLRVLEQRAFERVGGSRPIPLQARIISATNRDLTQALTDGTMRPDLFYRLRTVVMRIPPLRERREDIPLLVNHFIRLFNTRYGKNVRAVDTKVMDMFMSYSWPGNVRELQRVMEHAFVFVKGPVIFPSHLPEMEEFSPHLSHPGLPRSPSPEEERRQILDALAQAKGRRKEAARILGISRSSLWRRMKRLGLA